ncbi:hypothetical protein GCM10023339_06000 [Alloalcanivorax gelatiniphagus]
MTSSTTNSTTSSTTSNGPTAQETVRSTWAVLVREDLTWRQVTEGWTVLVTLGLLGLVAGTLVRAARSFAHSPD